MVILSCHSGNHVSGQQIKINVCNRTQVMPIRIFGLLILLLLPALSLADENYEKGKQAFLDGNYQEALQLLKPLAESGHSQAQVTLGIIYDNGIGRAHV